MWFCLTSCSILIKAGLLRSYGISQSVGYRYLVNWSILVKRQYSYTLPTLDLVFLERRLKQVCQKEEGEERASPVPSFGTLQIIIK